MTYQWWIGKCNELTIHKVDPVSHTPEDKFPACQVDAIADQVWAEGEVERQYTELKQALVDAAAPQDVEPGAAKFDDETHVNQIVWSRSRWLFGPGVSYVRTPGPLF